MYWPSGSGTVEAATAAKMSEEEMITAAERLKSFRAIQYAITATRDGSE